MADPYGQVHATAATASVPASEVAPLATAVPASYADSIVVKVEVLEAKSLRSIRNPNGPVNSYLGVRWWDPTTPNLEVHF